MGVPADDFVPEEALDASEIFRRGGQNYGDEDFALLKCPFCGRVYLMDYEVDTIFLDANDLRRRDPVAAGRFCCIGCRKQFPADRPWLGSKAATEFKVTWKDLEASEWMWVARRPSSA